MQRPRWLLSALLAVALCASLPTDLLAKGEGRHRRGGGDGHQQGSKGGHFGGAEQREIRRQQRQQANREKRAAKMERRIKRLAAYLDNVRAGIMTADEVLSKLRTRLQQLGDTNPEGKLSSIRGVITQAVSMDATTYDSSRLDLASTVANIMRAGLTADRGRQRGNVGSGPAGPPRSIVTRVDPDTGEELPAESDSERDSKPATRPKPTSTPTSDRSVAERPTSPTTPAERTPAPQQATTSTPPSGQVGHRVQGSSTVEAVGGSAPTVHRPAKSTMPMLTGSIRERADMVALLRTSLQCRASGDARAVGKAFPALPDEPPRVKAQKPARPKAPGSAGQPKKRKPVRGDLSVRPVDPPPNGSGAVEGLPVSKTASWGRPAAAAANGTGHGFTS